MSNLLNNPVVELGNRLVKPLDNTLHRGYLFYIKVTSAGTNSILNPPDTTEFFGPYDLRVGCYADTLTITDNASYMTILPNIYVGDNNQDRYTLLYPTASVSWCVPITTSIYTDLG